MTEGVLRAALRPDAAELGPSRWRGQPGRLEVWYATLTDPASGVGVWVHHELVAPISGPAYVHGWAAAFPPDGAAEFWRFGPQAPAPSGAAWFETADARLDASSMRGSAGPMSWDLQYADSGAPLYTFPRWAWEKESLPAAQVLPAPTARFSGTLRLGERVLPIAGAPGSVARIYGHGNAKRWAWLHADLGGGDVLEVVAAVSKRPGMNRLPPLPLMRLRLDGVDHPRDPLLSALAGSAKVALPRWKAEARWGLTRLRVEVAVPPSSSVAVEYTDPDGETCVCTNSERASAWITLQRLAGRRWRTEREWTLDGTAHAEVGLR
ncbi:MAG TPA: hypothetical protein VN193_14980 [Candidatus Angelobacter sp.]|nr:hypothetical protein [Candidatus Angelobacter sp.]